MLYRAIILHERNHCYRAMVQTDLYVLLILVKGVTYEIPSCTTQDQLDIMCFFILCIATVYCV